MICTGSLVRFAGRGGAVNAAETLQTSAAGGILAVLEAVSSSLSGGIIEGSAILLATGF